MLLITFRLFQEWQDENLVWDPLKYNNVNSLRIPTKQVWLPDTFIYNKYVNFKTFLQHSAKQLNEKYIMVNRNLKQLYSPVK